MKNNESGLNISTISQMEEDAMRHGEAVVGMVLMAVFAVLTLAVWFAVRI